MVVRRLAFVAVLAALLVVPATAGATLSGSHHASRAYLITKGPRAGELQLRIIANYPARPKALGPGPFYGYADVTLHGPGGTVHLHDLDQLTHPRRAERFDHRIDLTRSATRTLLGGKGRRARLTVRARYVVLGPLRRTRQAIVNSTPRISVPLLWVAGPPPGSGTLADGRGAYLTIGFSLDPNTAGAYDAVVTKVVPGGVVYEIDTYTTVPGNGVLMVPGQPTTDFFSATFSLTGAYSSACLGSATGTISNIGLDYDDQFDFDEASYSVAWTSSSRGGSCEAPLTGTMSANPTYWFSQY